MKSKTINKSAQTIPPAKTGSKHSGKKVRFKIKHSKAKSVALVGSFTEWDEQPIALAETEPGLWEVEVELASGRHEYLFLADERDWMPDAEAIESAPNPWGGFNSVINVELLTPLSK